MACDPVDELLWACRGFLRSMDDLVVSSCRVEEVAALMVGIRAQLDQLATAIRQTDRAVGRRLFRGDPGA